VAHAALIWIKYFMADISRVCRPLLLLVFSRRNSEDEAAVHSSLQFSLELALLKRIQEACCTGQRIKNSVALI
jgi:hypothetical protein